MFNFDIGVGIYIIGIYVAFAIAYWIDLVEFENEPGLIYVVAVFWPVAVALGLVYLPFYGLRKLIDWIKLEQGW